jgi:hypothetical protein
MSDYAILNFEDKITDTQKGAADSTILGLKARYENRKQTKGLSRMFLGKNSVTEYRCVDAGPPIGFTGDAARIATIRAACSTAKKVYLVMHGDPRDTDACYTNTVGSSSGVVHLSTPVQLATFLSRILSGKHEYRLALVMCYGARCRNYLSSQVNHQGMIPQADLVTSFAYRLFYALVHDHGLNVRLSAVTGKISHDSQTGGAMVEVEEMIDLNMEFSDANRAKLDSMKAAVGGTPKALNEQDATYKANYTAWSQGAEAIALTQRVKGIQDSKKSVLAALPPQKGSGAMHKYGKIEYRYKDNKLTIVSKYGDTSTTLQPGTVLYSGGLLAPG